MQREEKMDARGHDCQGGLVHLAGPFAQIVTRCVGFKIERLWCLVQTFALGRAMSFPSRQT